MALPPLAAIGDQMRRWGDVVRDQGVPLAVVALAAVARDGIVGEEAGAAVGADERDAGLVEGDQHTNSFAASRS